MTHQISFPELGLEFTLHREAFSVFGVSIYWYGLILGLGLVLAICYGLYEAKRVGIRQDDLLNMILLAVPIAIVCARLYYVVFSLAQYRDDWWSILDIRSGGLAIYGGILGACLTIVCYCKKKKLSLGMVLDVLAIGLLIGQAIGRWGNFVNAEAFGSETGLPWAMTIREVGKVVAWRAHPTFLYESVWNAVGIFLLLAYRKHTRFSGELFCAYLAWYGLGRSWIEGLRTDSLMLGSMRVSQILAMLTCVAGLTLLLCLRRRAAQPSPKQGKE